MKSSSFSIRSKPKSAGMVRPSSSFGTTCPFSMRSTPSASVP